MDKLKFSSISIISWVFFIILTRLLPHPPGSAPIFCATLFLGCFLAHHRAITLSLFAFIFSDIFLSLIYHYPLFGAWSFFNYIGLVIALFLGAKFLDRISLLNAFYSVTIATIVFWIWTNFGTWLTTALYPKTAAGLLACFVAGIPFLRGSILGNMAWGIIIFSPLILPQLIIKYRNKIFHLSS